jgi:hypothetical protein
VSGTCRDEEACDNFRAEGVDAHLLDSDNEQTLRCGMKWGLMPCCKAVVVPCVTPGMWHCSPDARRALASCCHIVSTVPPVADFDQDPVRLVQSGGCSVGALLESWEHALRCA